MWKAIHVARWTRCVCLVTLEILSVRPLLRTSGLPHVGCVSALAGNLEQVQQTRGSAASRGEAVLLFGPLGVRQKGMHRAVAEGSLLFSPVPKCAELTRRIIFAQLQRGLHSWVLLCHALVL